VTQLPAHVFSWAAARVHLSETGVCKIKAS
jgi:hypothetical protein